MEPQNPLINKFVEFYPIWRLYPPIRQDQTTTELPITPKTHLQELAHSLWDKALFKLQSYGLIDENGDLYPEYQIYLPKLNFFQIKAINDLLSQPIDVTFKKDPFSKEQKPFQFTITLKEYFESLSKFTTTKNRIFGITSIQIVGSTTANILGWKYFEDYFKAVFQKFEDKTQIKLILEDVFPSELISMVKTEIETPPSDLDFRIYMPYTNADSRNELKFEQTKILLELAKKYVEAKPHLRAPSTSEAQKSMYVDLMNFNEGNDQFLLVSLSNRKPENEIKVDLNFISYSTADTRFRDHLFERDAMAIPIESLFYNKEKPVIYPVSSLKNGSSFFFNRFTRILGMDQVDQINRQGWIVLQSLSIKGYREFDLPTTDKLLQTTLNKIPAYDDKGYFFANTWEKSLCHHHSNLSIDAVVLALQYYTNLEKKLGPEKMVSFEKSALAYIKNLPQPELSRFPLFAALFKDLKDGTVTFSEAIAFLQIVSYFCLSRDSTGNHTLVSISNRQLELVAYEEKPIKAYSLRLPVQFVSAFQFLASNKLRATDSLITCYSTLLKGKSDVVSEKSFLSEFWQELEIDLNLLQDAAKALISAEEELKIKLGFQLLLDLGTIQNNYFVQTSLIKEFPEALSLFDENDRKLLLERMESCFVEKERLKYPQLFTSQVKSELASAKDSAQIKKIWLKALLKTGTNENFSYVPRLLKEMNIFIKEKSLEAFEIYLIMPSVAPQLEDLKHEIEASLAKHDAELFTQIQKIKAFDNDTYTQHMHAFLLFLEYHSPSAVLKKSIRGNHEAMVKSFISATADTTVMILLNGMQRENIISSISEKLWVDLLPMLEKVSQNERFFTLIHDWLSQTQVPKDVSAERLLALYNSILEQAYQCGQLDTLALWISKCKELTTFVDAKVWLEIQRSWVQLLQVGLGDKELEQSSSLFKTIADSGEIESRKLLSIGLSLAERLIEKSNAWEWCEIISRIYPFIDSNSEIVQKIQVNLKRIVLNENDPVLLPALCDLSLAFQVADEEHWVNLFKQIRVTNNPELIGESLKIWKKLARSNFVLSDDPFYYFQIFEIAMDGILNHPSEMLFSLIDQLNMIKEFLDLKNDNNKFPIILKRMFTSLCNYCAHADVPLTLKDNPFSQLLEWIIIFINSEEARGEGFDVVSLGIKTLSCFQRYHDRQRLALELNYVVKTFLINNDIYNEHFLNLYKNFISQIQTYETQPDFSTPLKDLLCDILFPYGHNPYLAKATVEAFSSYKGISSIQALMFYSLYLSTLESPENENKKLLFPNAKSFFRLIKNALEHLNKPDRDIQQLIFHPLCEQILGVEKNDEARLIYVERFLKLEEKKPDKDLCQRMLIDLIEWIVKVKDRKTEEKVMDHAFWLIHQLVDVHKDIKDFQNTFISLFYAFERRRNDSKTLYKYVPCSFEHARSYQFSALQNSQKEICANKVPQFEIVAITIDESEEKTFFDPNEERFNYYFKQFLIKTLANKNPDPIYRSFYLDFAYFNIYHFAIRKNVKTQDCLDLMHAFFESVIPDKAGLHAHHSMICLDLLQQPIIQPLIQKNEEKFFEFHVRANSRCEAKLDAKKKGEIIEKVLMHYLRFEPGDDHLECFNQAIFLMELWQNVVMTEQHEIRLRCYKKLLKGLEKFPATKMGSRYFHDTLRLIIFVSRGNFLNLKNHDLHDSNYKAVTCYFDTLVEHYQKIKNHMKQEARLGLIDSIHQAWKSDAASFAFLSHPDEWLKQCKAIQPIFFEYVKDYPENGLPMIVIKMTELIVSKDTDKPDFQKKRVKILNDWIEQLLTLPNQASDLATCALKVAENRSGYAKFPDMLQSIKAKIHLKKT